MLMKGQDVVIYVAKDDKWKKGKYKINELDEEGYYKEIMDNEETIPKQHLQRYLDLAKRLRDTYFKEPDKD